MKKNKHFIIIIIIIILFIIFNYIYFRRASYKLEYQINDFNIVEEYNKEMKAYFFTITKKDKEYNLVSLSNYTTKRRLINEIEVEDSCLNFKTTNINLYSICNNEDEYYLKNINDSDNFTKESSYENIEIDSLENNTYLLWNYHDFIYINKEKEKKFSLFSKDIYNINLIYQYNNLLLIPDYEQEYIYNKIYTINTDKAQKNTINLRFEIYFDSYFLGDYKEKVYIYDLKNNQEYYIDMKEEKLYKTESEILVNNKWQKISSQTFKNDKPTFEQDLPVSYILENNKLYIKVYNSDNLILASSREIKQIVKIDNLDVYYISEDTLYKHNPIDGEKALLRYSEWNFNYKNMVFIF